MRGNRNTHVRCIPKSSQIMPGNCPKCGMKLVPKKAETNAKLKGNARESRDMHQHHGDEAMPPESLKYTPRKGTNRTTCRICRCRCNRQ